IHQQVVKNMIGRKIYRIVILTLLTALFSIFVIAQNPTGREAPKPAKKEPTPAPKEKTKSVASSARSANAGNSGSSAKSVKSHKPVAGRAPAGKTAAVLAKLTIVAPPGASVEVDGKPRGVVAVDGNLVLGGLAPGDHQLIVSATGYEPWRDTFVMSTASTRFEVPIKKKTPTGRLALSSTEPGTEILIDEKYGVKTIQGGVTGIDGLLPGVRQLRAIKPGFKEWRETVVVKANETVAVTVELKPILDPEMLRIPEGQFTRGNDKGARDQRPSHQVFTTAFEISRSEVNNR